MEELNAKPVKRQPPNGKKSRKPRTHVPNPKGRPENLPSNVQPDPEGLETGIGFVLDLTAMPEIDLADDEAVEKRCRDYFELCAVHRTKPLVNGLATALGLSRQELGAMVRGGDISSTNCRFTTARARRLSPRSTATVKNFYNSMQTLWEFYFTNGYIRDAPGIFLAKNHFGYKDIVENVITPNNPLGDAQDAESIAAKYREQLPEPEDTDGEG